jgi:hypothetical protein
MNTLHFGKAAVLVLFVALLPRTASAADTRVCPVYGGKTYVTAAPLYLLRWPSAFELAPTTAEKPPNFVKLIPAGAQIKVSFPRWLVAEKQDFYSTVFLTGHDIDDQLVIARHLFIEECFNGAYVEAPPADVRPGI